MACGPGVDSAGGAGKPRSCSDWGTGQLTVSQNSLSYENIESPGRRISMIALLIGVLLILFAVYSVLPFSWSLNWWPDVIQFLKGGVPLIAVFIGLISFFVGVADIKDKIESRKEEQEEEEEEAEPEKAK
jgi:hypothetical protein